MLIEREEKNGFWLRLMHRWKFADSPVCECGGIHTDHGPHIK